MILHDAVKKYVFKQHFGDDGALDWKEMIEDYDPLIIVKVKCSMVAFRFNTNQSIILTFN